ncbi:steroid monooxygenase [Colletotrichum sublineola]|nr:steroid monooxygenase [Colletotrichum sublineola]
MKFNKAIDYDVVIVGAGFSGIRTLWEVRRLGLTAVCYEAGLDVGGAWYWNRYPGARTDGEAWIYVMNFTPELRDEWNYHERYPSQEEVQRYLSGIVDRFDLRKDIAFGIRVMAAHYSDNDNTWTLTTADGQSTTCRYFIAATGTLSVPQDPPYPGLNSFTGEWYQTANWPAHRVDFQNKRIAVVGTGSTGVQVISALAPIAKNLSVFQRTPNYVLPGRNYNIDEHLAHEIKQNMDVTWDIARKSMAGQPIKSSGRILKDMTDNDKIRQIFDYGWERGCFQLQLETFDDIILDPESNKVFSEYIRSKIRAIVQDPNTADILCPTYPFGAKRPPCGHFYYEAFNRPNVHLIDISQDEIDIYERGIRTSSGVEHEFDMIIFALGFDAITGALGKIDIKGSKSKSLKEYWAQDVTTFGGALVPGFPNMFMVCGPQTPIGNMPVMIEMAVTWIGKTLRYMEEKHLATVNVSEKASDAWTQHNNEVFNSTWFPEPAKATHNWAIGTNIPGKPFNVLCYFGGVPSWNDWLEKEAADEWPSMEFTRIADSESKGEYAPGQDISSNSASAIVERLESMVMPLQSDEAGISQAEKVNICNAVCARYMDWAVREMQDRGLAPKPDHRLHWWKVLQKFVHSEEGRRLIQESPSTVEQLDHVTSKLGVEGEAIARIGHELVRLLTGKTLPLSLLMKDNLLYRLYLSDEGARSNLYVAEFVRMLTSRKRDLRILEVGAGTGGTTFHILRLCSPNGAPFCSNYTFTDISPGFFKTCLTTLGKWKDLLTFQTLNIESNPAKQRLEEKSYDLIIASNVIHTTQSLRTSLANVHKLLRPGGVLALMEPTRLTPYYNLIFGSLPGWWAGIDEGRTESPLQSADQWNEHLRNVGFSGIDLVAYDLPEPERHNAFLVSTALES